MEYSRCYCSYIIICCIVERKQESLIKNHKERIIDNMEGKSLDKAIRYAIEHNGKAYYNPCMYYLGFC